MTYPIASAITLLLGLVSFFQNDKTLRYEDWSYEAEIRTVMLYPFTGRPQDMLQPPASPLGTQNLVLEFDDLVDSPEDYMVRIIHCNSDWKPSGLRALDYLFDYNEFNVNSYEFSIDTKLAYIHYRFQVPRVKIPGNYLLVAYRENNPKDIILTKRFMVFENRVNVLLSTGLNNITSLSRMNQQLDFAINYQDFPIQNPMEQITIVLRQNQRWDNVIRVTKPTFFREIDKMLEYRFFAEKDYFTGGNEFRFFDMRSLRSPGQNVAYTDLSKRPTQVVLGKDKPRIFEVYSLLNDLNGNFIVSNMDTGNGVVESDYVETVFTLESDPLPGDVYVVGRMNNYHYIPENKMQYDRSRGIYTGRQILKQGWYDYQYIIKNDTLPMNYLEGNHFETENEYEILVYYTPLEMRGDQLVGYRHITLNERLR
ncbi:DUF5103 domain-containing protein [Fulvivirga sedimenti]|uniref:DUF5103 domain-containing protein n=1 Tax=Fulvivirga sedimenti TaxID=2879465 RepID=A0A9X1HUG3_9BACT|nr:DUF5103 domain-containing protein [Fulvivirga sedimenti]MCA6074938.1 DUF5103 domain-containing protein [Fulvivirga sedimenti]MCA6076115.1 DUF5103 domain-containing protein [Fulvivirga sedimenti]MCA6077243.1 DUF5103 domain-containing protein [Fulvivirga sedimenti]